MARYFARYATVLDEQIDAGYLCAAERARMLATARAAFLRAGGNFPGG
ncbi:protein of unknown function [Blastococcus saxobsidens DD2]|uniref:Uncharacterized protein n=1 Tax=Blastococcus saxobsidens (strain DD2) TaxID=1146883 RepID=H6RR39_BLASD|nr:protein of unknown function [Blastococcus saxobsidens DD2]